MRQAVIHTRQKLNTSERRTCAVLDVARSSLHYKAKTQDDDALRLAIIKLAKQYGRYGYRKITELLRIEGWRVNKDRCIIDGIPKFVIMWHSLPNNLG